MEILAVIALIEKLSVALPALTNIITHYAQLKDDPRLKATEVEEMVANLEELKLRDRKDL